jgi:hypothetical protein
MSNGKIYLSGGMQYAKNLGGGWRTKCSTRLRKMDFLPLDITALDLSYSKEHGELYSVCDTKDDIQRKSDIRKHFVYSDLELIRTQTDALITYYDRSARMGAGTISECQFAYLHDIPNFIVSSYKDWRNEIPGWLYALSTKLFTSFKELYVYLDTLPHGILKRDIYGNRHSGNKYLCSLCGEPFTKRKHQFVSKVIPLYCHKCVDVVVHTNENTYDRYAFFLKCLKE